MKKLLLVFLLIVLATIVYFLRGSEVTYNLDTYIYELPFKEGTKHKVVEGYGGRFSHSNKAALDFAMPEGTPVYAAREGRIYSYKDDSNEGGLFTNEKKANYIIIKHNDGSFGCHWHLKQYGVVVKKGFVAKGQLIGYSGRTGFVLWPHLHFAVKRRLNYQKDSFVRTKFFTTKGIVLLKAGESYETLWKKPRVRSLTRFNGLT
jgi:murein DD-endopeptidase MepM/ murein hydrolase activator NlpD